MGPNHEHVTNSNMKWPVSASNATREGRNLQQHLLLRLREGERLNTKVTHQPQQKFASLQINPYK